MNHFENKEEQVTPDGAGGENHSQTAAKIQGLSLYLGLSVRGTFSALDRVVRELQARGDVSVLYVRVSPVPLRVIPARSVGEDP